MVFARTVPSDTATKLSFRCRDAAQNWSPCKDATYVEDSTPPYLSGTLAATADPDSPYGVHLQWPAATDAVGPVSYDVCASTSPTGPPTQCGKKVDITASPTAKRVTPSPTATTSPAPSDSGMRPAGAGSMPVTTA